MGTRGRSVIDETKKRYGRLKVIAFAGLNRRGEARWLCACKCGKRSVVVGSNLRSGHSTSCGCSREAAKFRHGHCVLRRSRTYQSWYAMLQRCTNPNTHEWMSYGGRGIKVCKRWRTFDNFLADMKSRPRSKTLDRINNNGNYTPRNCRWATRSQQDSNKRRSKRRAA
jgi:hypothetical protein